MASGSMTNQQVYAILSVYFNDQLLIQEAQATIKRESKATVNESVQLGFAGMSMGAAQMTISITNIVPAAGLEFDPGYYIANLVGPDGKPLKVSFRGNGGKTLTAQMWVQDDSLEHGINTEAKQSINLIGPFAPWT